MVHRHAKHVTTKWQDRSNPFNTDSWRWRCSCGDGGAGGLHKVTNASEKHKAQRNRPGA